MAAFESTRYDKLFTPLLNITPDSDIKTLLQGRFVLPKNPFQFPFKPPRSRIQTDELPLSSEEVKGIISTIKEWNTLLDKELWDCQQKDPSKIPDLKALGERIYNNHLITHLSSKIEYLPCHYNSALNAVKRLSQLVSRIIEVRPPFTPDPIEDSPPIVIPRSGTPCPEITYLCEAMAIYSEPSEKNMIKVMSRTVTKEEALAILKAPVTQLSNLAFVIGFLPMEKLQYAMLHLKTEEIQQINQQLQGLSKEMKVWLNKRFRRIRQFFIDSRNETDQRIDELAERFRKEDEISARDLEEIKEVQSQIPERKTATDHLINLIKDIYYNPETEHSLPTASEYYTQNQRLNKSEESIKNIRDNLWGTLYRVYLQKSPTITLSSSPEELLAWWNLFNVETLRELGLLSSSPLEASEDSEKDIAIARLSQIGLRCIHDFITHEIFSPDMFREYCLRNLLV